MKSRRCGISLFRSVGRQNTRFREMSLACTTNGSAVTNDRSALTVRKLFEIRVHVRRCSRYSCCPRHRLLPISSFAYYSLLACIDARDEDDKGVLQSQRPSRRLVA